MEDEFCAVNNGLCNPNDCPAEFCGHRENVAVKKLEQLTYEGLGAILARKLKAEKEKKIKNK